MWFLLACLPKVALVDQHSAAEGRGPAPGVNAAVIESMAAYGNDGAHGFHWPPDDGVWWGTTHDVWYQGALLSPGDPEGRSHCVGLTWEVAMAVLAEAAGGVDRPINGLTPAQIHSFRADWFVRELGGAGAADAVENFGVGESIPWQEAQPGDFLQFWTTGGGGHSGIFEAWVRRGRRIVGVQYWSTHPAIPGIGSWTDPIGPHGVDRHRIHVARLYGSEDWRPVGGSAE